MPEDQELTTPRRRSRRQDVPAETTLAAQATPTAAVTAPVPSPAAEAAGPEAEAEAHGNGVAKPTRRRAPKAAASAEATPGTDAANGAATATRSRRARSRAAIAEETATAAGPGADVDLAAAAATPASTTEEAGTSRGGHGPRVSRPRGRRAAVAPEATGAERDTGMPRGEDGAAPGEPVPTMTTETGVLILPARQGRGRRGRHGERAAANGAEPLISETASGVSLIREGAPAEQEQPAPAAEAPAAPTAAQPAPEPRSRYRFRRGAPAGAVSTPAPAMATDEQAAAPIAPEPTPPSFEPGAPQAAAPEEPATPAAPVAETPAQPLGEGERRTSSDVVVRPLRRDRWANQEGRDGFVRERTMPHIPGGEPYRGQQPVPGQGQSGDQRPQQGPGSAQRPARQQNQPGARGGAPYSPGAGRPQQEPRPGTGYEQPNPYGQRGGVPGQRPEAPGYAPQYPMYDPYTGYPLPPQQGAGPNDRQQGGMRGRNYPQQGYPDQRGQRGNVPGRGQGEYYNPRDGRNVHGGRGPNDRRMGRMNRRDREYAGYGMTTAYPPAEGRYGNAAGVRGPATPARTVDVTGLLWLGGGPGLSPAEVLDNRTLQPVARMNLEDVRRMGLRSGDMVSGRAEERGGKRIVVAVDTVNDGRPEDLRERPVFEQLTAAFPDRRIRLEHGPQPVSARIIDLFAPLGFGSRALVVAPPKTGKTTLIREAAEAVLTGYPEAVVMAVLVGERPEEVTDLRARLEPRGGIVYAASFDEDTQRHAWLVQVAVERAKRVAESGKDAFMVLDSLTRLARAENLASRGAGRTLSGGIDAQALDTGRRAFGAARNLEEGGSITILATCLVDTGSRQDDVVYEEFKGTGNMELHLSRDLAQRRLFPAVDAIKSGTRREEMLLTPEELRAATALRRRLADLPTAAATDQLLKVLERTSSNAALIAAVEQSGWMAGAR